VDISSLKRRENFKKIYIYKEENEIKAIILPVRGLGLWGTLYGYLAIESDLNTIIGLEYFSHKETPGLGAEVDNPRWKSQWKGKNIYSSTGEIKIEVIKGLVDPESPEKKYQVDGLSGATITSRGVSNMLSFWLGELGYAKFLNRLKEEIERKESLNV
jgi:Na+-transporting NADH:ubiquinone oxidoreductase subunit C